MPQVSERAVHINRDLTTTQETLLENNPQRRYALLVNPSDTDAYISLGVPAAANEGILIVNGGGSYEINLTNPFFGRIHGVSLGATKRMMITEISNAA